MDVVRRKVLQGMGSVAVATMPGISLARRSHLKVGVVGGGIIGASVAMYLAKAGAEVTLFEKIAPTSGATSKSFAWLNANNDDQHYRDFRLRSLAAYHALDKQLQLDITWGGYVNWESEPNVVAELRARAANFSRTGYPMRMLSAEDFAIVAPNISPGSFEAAVYAGMDGHLDPVAVTHKLLAQAKKYGARIIYPCEVVELILNADRLTGIATTSGEFSLDRLVIASGVDAPVLTAKVGYVPPLTHAPGILAHSAPIDPITRTVNYGSGVHFKQLTNGVVVAADSSYPPQTPVHRDIRRERLNFPNDEIRNMHGRRILDRITVVLPGARDAQLDRLTLGFRPLPKDDFPIVGFLPGRSDIYIAVMHSGVTLAPVIGQSVSKEMLDDNSVESLTPYRPDRFLV
jgi:glycine/D-amino acid oxidase-like deaminating enzyme